MRKEKRDATLSVLTAMTLFGTIGVFVRNIPLPSGVIALVRAGIGTLFLLTVMAARRQRPRLAAIRKNLLWLCLSGGAIGVNWILLFEAYRYTTVATATLCYYLAPVFVILLSPLLLKEKLTGKKLLCALLALCGMVLVSGVLHTNVSAGQQKGVLLGVGAAAMYAGVILLNKQLRDISAYERTVVQLGVATVVLLPYVLLTGWGEPALVTPLSWGCLLVVGVVHTGWAYALYFGALGRLPAQTAALLSYVDPVVAVLLSALLLGEPMDGLSILGALLVLGATLWGELPARKRP